jgi:hypothetical protein
VFLKDLSLGSTFVFITVLWNAIKHSKYFLSADTIKIARSISSATVSTLAQSAVDSFRVKCAADFMKLNTDESQKYNVD